MRSMRRVERAASARDRYAIALRSTASELAMQHQQVASLTDAVTVLRTEVATLDGLRRRTAAARDYYADSWHETESALAAQREQGLRWLTRWLRCARRSTA